MDNWVVTFVKTGSEAKVIKILEPKLDKELFMLFLPTKVEPLKAKGIWRETIKLLFPGYIFARAKIKPDLIASVLNPILDGMKSSHSVIRLLHYGDDKKSVAMRERERKFLEQLLDSNHCIVGSKGFIADNKIHITEGALMGLEDKIKKIDRHQRKAILNVEFAGELCEMRLPLEITDKK